MGAWSMHRRSGLGWRELVALAALALLVSPGCFRLRTTLPTPTPTAVLLPTATPSLGPAYPAAPKTPMPLGERVHTVQPGDTLWDLSQKYGVSVEAIATANHIKDPDAIFPGQKLVIPP